MLQYTTPFFSVITTILSLSSFVSMDATQNSSSFSCEIRILQAKDIKFTSSKNLFVRYYLSAGNHKRIRLNTREISSKSDFFWNECFSLECLGTQDSIHSLKQASVVFELRQAKTLPFLDRIAGSQLLGRAKIPWEQVFELPNMVIDKWVTLVSANGSVREGLKQPKLEIGMTVGFPEKMEMEKMRRCRKWNDECGCKSNMDHCADYDIFAIAAAVEFL